MAFIESEDQEAKTFLWRAVFGSPDGKKVLEEMLTDMSYFSSIDPKDEQRMALRNYAATIMYNIGVTIDPNIPQIIDKLLSIDYKPICKEKLHG